MIWFDFVILGIIAISVVVGVIRGFVREALSLVSWVISFWVAMAASPTVAEFLGDYIAMPAARRVVAFVTLFLATLLVGGTVNTLIVRFVRWTGLGSGDRLIGLLFGVGRGVLLVVVLVLVLGYTPLVEEPWWQQSLLAGYCQTIAAWLTQWVPQNTLSVLTNPVIPIVPLMRPPLAAG